jgi:pyruvate kinase
MPEKFTKIVSTIGPASRNYETILSLINEGVNVFRLNFSHGNTEDHKLSVDLVRRASRELDKTVAIFQDLQGPKIRVGNLKDEYIELAAGDKIIISGGDFEGTKGHISIDYNNLHNEVCKDGRILIDDGLIELRVDEVDGKNIHTVVVTGGKLKPRKGVNLPHVKLQNISSFTEKDMEDLKFAFENYLDYIALSFVRSANDVIALRNYMSKEFGRTIPVISKIEKPEAVDDIDNIIEVSDAIMVARGDLGVETSSEEVPIIQKRIIRKCNLAGKPVITATQMLESMINNPRPTRAESADVANAILDGSSAIMLSGETAVGKYPVESVQMMTKIALFTESTVMFKKLVLEKVINIDLLRENALHNTPQAVGLATVELADTLGAKYIVCFTHSGGTARLISKFRPDMKIIGFSPVASTVRRLALAWGVIPLHISEVETVDELLDGAAEALKYKGMVKDGDFIVITAGVPVGKTGKTNMIKVVRIGE